MIRATGGSTLAVRFTMMLSMVAFGMAIYDLGVLFDVH